MAPKRDENMESKLIEKRKQYKSTILRIQEFVLIHADDIVTDNLKEQLEIRKETLDNCYNKYQDIQADILCINPGDEEQSEIIENIFFDICANIKVMLAKGAAKTNQTGPVSTTKLPHIDIPIFEGKNLNNFKPFIDIFTAVIDKNINLSNVEKLFYLRNYLRGEALLLINTLPIVNESYIEALKLLKNRYDNEVMLINSHIYSLLDIPNMQKGNTAALREFVSKVRQQIGALKNLKQPIDSWDMIIICILSRKLDQYTNRAYQIDRNSSRLPTLNDFLLFLENRATALEAVVLPENKNSKEKSHFTHLGTTNKNSIKCLYCSIPGHKIYNCKTFKSIPVSDRISFIKNNKYCKICLNGHKDKCKYSYTCQVCKKDHNTLLHLSNQNNNQEAVTTVQSAHCYADNNFENVLLPTVKVRLKGRWGQTIVVRGLIDSGSQTSFITTSLVKKLKLRTFNNNLNVVGISENVTQVQKCVNIKLESCVHDYSINLNCAVVERITGKLPQFEFDPTSIQIPNIKLADDEFNKSQNIDLLLGANVFFQVLLNSNIKLGKNVVLQNTLFGYVISGVISSNLLCKDNFCNLGVTLFCTTTKLENVISQFWETEKVPEVYTEYPTEQEACELIFQNSVVNINNKFQVCLPLKQKLEDLNLGDSFSIAYKRFENLEKRFRLNPELFSQYKKFIDEYLNLGHGKIVNITDYDLNNNAVYFMAHHPVIKEDKRTTKLRVVFDGSMKTKNKKSINDLMYNGAIVQKELFDVLLLFRTYEYVFCTDIKQMYRMVLIHPDHRSLQNILWRDNSNSPIKCIQLQTVTYGLKSSPFLATRCLVELAHKEGHRFPLATKALLNNIYVDDILSGSDTILETIRLKNELIEILKLGSFELHKWCANDPSILHDIPSEKQHFDERELSEDNVIVKTLGLSYDMKLDVFKVSSPNTSINECVTKRQVLSFICQFYDPLGFAGPVLVAAKVIMQRLWINKVRWDDILPTDLLNIWQNFVKNIIEMPAITIPRKLHFYGANKIELVGYCDASTVAYGAVLYIRSIFTDRVYVNLLCSKSRIAPLNKTLTIPKLELNSAVLLVNLASKVHEVLKYRINEVFLYSDSNIVLTWIKTDPLKLNSYVANRIIKIQASSSNFCWNYINTNDNPADCLSRGLDPQHMVTNKFWFHGPHMLLDNNFSHYNNLQFKFAEPLPEKKVQSFTHTVQLSTSSFFEKFSNISKLQRVVAYMLRFIHNSKNMNNKFLGNLTLPELNNALNVIIKHEQSYRFKEEIKCLNSKLELKSPLKSLHPFVDKDSILRVGGRLQNASIPFDQKYPIILPKKNHVTNLIIVREHLRLLHAGQKQVLSSLNLKYWIINGIREIKKNIHKCVTCFRLKAKCSEQLMGSLPEARVNLARPFQNVGIDFCGPFLIKQSRIRKSLVTKGYIALFVCFSVKAIHMELLSDLTTECFLAAFKRFIFRRGKPAHVYCDNGSTFKGANNQLKEFYKVHSSPEHKNKINTFCIEEHIEFNFIPSYSPVFGGLWEAGVKSAKFHIKRVMGNSQFTYEQFNTLIVQVEGILNSRPITQLSNDPVDLTYLTPGHFLIGVPITSYPEPDLTSIPENKLKFWKLCTQVQQHFWNKWHKDYLTQLQNRPKWHRNMPNVQEGMLVLLKDENLPPLKWPMARITKVIPGRDGKVRVVQVKGKKGIYLRSITKIAVLPVY